MTEDLIKSIVFSIFGAVILATGIFCGSGVEIIVLGSLVLFVGVIFILIDTVFKEKKRR